MPVSIPHILENTFVVPRQLPLVPELCFYLMTDDYPQHALTRDEYLRMMSSPPYWAFCWGGGQALARWITDNPAFVAERDVVDFGAGSGVAGIAAAINGARSVLAVDVDRDALQICQLNAVLNGVSLATAPSCYLTPDTVLLAADVGYEEDAFALVVEHIRLGGRAIIAESRLRGLDVKFPSLGVRAVYEVRTFPDLDEAKMFDQVHIYSTF